MATTKRISAQKTLVIMMGILKEIGLPNETPKVVENFVVDENGKKFRLVAV